MQTKKHNVEPLPTPLFLPSHSRNNLRHSPWYPSIPLHFSPNPSLHDDISQPSPGPFSCGAGFYLERHSPAHSLVFTLKFSTKARPILSRFNQKPQLPTVFLMLGTTSSDNRVTRVSAGPAISLVPSPTEYPQTIPKQISRRRAILVCSKTAVQDCT